MVIHFEELWEQSENLQKEASIDASTVPAIINEVIVKLNLYQALDTKALPPEEKQNIQTRVFGEILLTLTSLSLKENVNVYDALKMALQFHSIEHYNKIHQA